MACFAVSTLFFSVSQADASFNQQINYQGKLTDHSDVAVADGNYDMVFRLCADSACSSVLWTETRTGADQVAVTNGLFSVMLGSVTALSSVDFNQDLYLEVAVSGETLTPRKRLGAVPNALNALELDGLATTSFLRADIVNSRATITNLTSTNFFADKASITNATSTNFFANAVTALSSVISNLTATIANITTLVFGDATGSTLAVTDLSVTSTANIKTLNVSSTLAINSTSTNLFSTYASITQATTTNFYTSVFNAVSGWFTNLTASIADITDLTVARSTTTAATSTNSYLGTTAGLNGVYINNWSDISTLAGSWATSSSDYWESTKIRWSTTSEQYFWNTTTTWAGFQSNFNTYYSAATAKNPFNQWLDTTNTPTFAGLTLSGNLSVTGTSTLATTTFSFSGGNTTSSIYSYTFPSTAFSGTSVVMSELGTVKDSMIIMQTVPNESPGLYMGVVDSDNLLVQSFDALQKNLTFAVYDNLSNIVSLNIFSVTAEDFKIFSNGADPEIYFGSVGTAGNANIGWTSSTDVLAFYNASGGYTFDNKVTVSSGGLNISGNATATTAVISSNLTVGSLNGILQAANGLVSVSSSPYLTNLNLSGNLTISNLTGVLQATNGLLSVTSSPFFTKLSISTTTAFTAALTYVTTSLPDVSGGASNSAVYGDYLYVVMQSATSTNRLRIFDISNPDNPILLDSDFSLQPGLPDGGARCIEVDGKYAYIGFEDYDTGSTTTLSILDITDPTNPVEMVGSNYTNDYALRKLRVIDGLLYAAYYTTAARGYDGLQIIDVSDPSNPARISASVSGFPGETRGIDIQGKYAYTVSYFDTSTDVFRITDISDPYHPVVVGGQNLAMSPLGRDVVVRGNYAYTTSDCFGPTTDAGITSTQVFRIIDISSSTNPVIVGGSGLSFSTELGYSGASGLAVQGDYAYVVDAKGRALRIINISNPYNPFFVDSLSLVKFPWGVEVAGNRAYLPLSANPNNELVIVKLPGMETPTARVGSIVSGGLQVLRDLITIGLGKFFGVIVGGGGLKVAGETNLNSTTTIGFTTSTPTHKLTVTSNDDWLKLTSDGDYGIDFYWDDTLMGVPIIAGHASTSAFTGGSDYDLIGIKDQAILYSTNRDSVLTFTNLQMAATADIAFNTTTELLYFQSAKTYQWLDYNDSLPFVTFDADGKAVTVTSTLTVTNLNTNGIVYSNNGTLTNVNPSSREYKEEIIDTDLDIDALLGLQVKSFVWKKTGQTDFGLIAEEIRDVLPELYMDDGLTRGYRFDHLSFYLLQIAQRQEQELGVLSAQLSELVSTSSDLAVTDASVEETEELDSLTVDSSATFYGTITVIGEAGFESKVVFKDHIYLDKDAAGTVELPVGATSTAVYFAKPYEVDPIITLTPLLNVAGHNYWVEAQSSTGFILAVDLPFTAEMRFNWHAIAVKSDESGIMTNDEITDDGLNIVLSSSSLIILQNDFSTTTESSSSNPFFVSSTSSLVTDVIGASTVLNTANLGVTETTDSDVSGTIQSADMLADEPPNPETLPATEELPISESAPAADEPPVTVTDAASTVVVANVSSVDPGSGE
ncbi:MAG: tail fiber domain-containing protein [Candidatus Buchananbacteria bacterium]